jgi:hypothetical protein
MNKMVVGTKTGDYQGSILHLSEYGNAIMKLQLI